MYMNEFIQFIRQQKRYSDHTVTAYRKDIQLLQSYLQQQYEIDDWSVVSFQQIRSYVVYLMRDGISEKSINRKLSSLRSFFKYLLRKGYVESNPTAQIVAPKIPKRLPSYLKPVEVNQLLDQIVDYTSFESTRDHLLMTTLLLLGLRRSEVIEIKDSDIDVVSGTLTVIGKGNKERKLPLSKGYLNRYQNYMQRREEQEPNHNYIFITNSGKKLYPKFLYNLVKKQIQSVSAISKKSPHVLRHTFATLLSDNGAQITAIKDLLGHSSLAATQVYTHSSIRALQNAYEKAHPRS